MRLPTGLLVAGRKAVARNLLRTPPLGPPHSDRDEAMTHEEIEAIIDFVKSAILDAKFPDQYYWDLVANETALRDLAEKEEG